MIFGRSGGEDHRSPFNTTSDALLAMVAACITGYEPGEFVRTFEDAHLHLNHLGQADLRIARKPCPLPRVRLVRDPPSLFGIREDDVERRDYRCHPTMRATASV